MFKRSAKEGLEWIKDSFALFRRYPSMWMLLALAYVFLFIVMPSLQGLPAVIKLFVLLTSPTFLVLVISLYREVDQGRVPQAAKLFPLIKSHAGKLLSLGGICLLYGVLISMLIGSDMKVLNEMTNAKSSLDEMATIMLPLTLKVLVLFAPLMMATWFAPMLIVHHEFPIFRAIKSSIAGSLYSALSLGVAWILLTCAFAVVMMVAGIVVGIVASISPFVGVAVGAIILLLSLLVGTAMMLAFQYVSYRDVFERKFANVVEAQPS
ncbi:hypothetical protein A7981_09195 [Methylovorus sp. MM2]|uniref:BPSS1780 family membrane protein n=1 Tax=Methylovorus sp. MM2 TaxID=1848038 RepID=UPI0007E1C1F2|nr:BPSS1780 family membrane protein [Methylovorus sp. MM2]OAM51637.1 hypothetical protein A7981_09195 [Methylovorus sp. MM2]